MNSPQALAEYARSTDVWVCASETLGSRWPYKEMLERDALHVVMVDLCWTGGLTEGRKIAALAETWHRPFAPHDCIGPVGFVAAVHMLVQPAEHADPGIGPRLLHAAGTRSSSPRCRRSRTATYIRWKVRASASSCCPRSSSAPTSPSAARQPLRSDHVRPTLFALDGRTALVTGSSRGLGRAWPKGSPRRAPRWS